MIGGRSFVTAIKNGCGSSLMRGNLIGSNAAFNMRSLSSFKVLSPMGSSSQQKSARPQVTELKLISKRFAHYGNGPSSSGEPTWTYLAKLVSAAVGAIIGFGGSTIFGTGDGLLKNFNASCAPKDCVDKKCDDSPCLRKMDCEEELIIKANADLEKALKDVKSKAIEYTEAAMKAYCDAIVVMKEYLNQAYCVIDADELEPPQYEEAWCCVYKIAKDRCQKVKDALQKGQCAWELLCRLREVIENGKACKFTSCNPLLVTAEESLTCAERELLNLKARMDCVSSDHDMVEQYQQVIESFRRDLKKEVDAVVESGQCQIDYAEQATALMIMQAYKKVVSAQKEVAQVMVCTGSLPERLQKTQC